MDKRPLFNKSIKLKDFRDFYWLKEELIKFCRKEGLLQKGGKIELTKRIEIYLKTGKKKGITIAQGQNPSSKFDWNKETLTLHTKITGNYKNTSNVRQFFTEQLGKQFKFNVNFMNWMKVNVGKTLQDAVYKWEIINIERKKNTNPKMIAPQFEYNRYIRDFLKDNPKMSRNTAIKCWKIKKTLRGNNIYIKSDLKFLKNDYIIKIKMNKS